MTERADNISWYDVAIAGDDLEKTTTTKIHFYVCIVPGSGGRGPRLHHSLSCVPAEGSKVWKRPYVVSKPWPTHQHRTVPGMYLALIHEALEAWHAAIGDAAEQLPLLSALEA